MSTDRWFWLVLVIAVGGSAAAYFTGNLRVVLATGIGLMFFVYRARPFSLYVRVLIYCVAALAMYLLAVAVIDRVAP